MMLNLINDAWIPAMMPSGRIRKIRPSEVVDPELSALAMPRSDLNGALRELLIALLTTAAAPASEEEWALWWKSPPEPSQLHKLLAAHADAFDLNAFMQVELDCDAEPVGNLLIDAPGENTIERNADFLGRAGDVSALSPSAAAVAVFALQSYAPQGGRGYATSIRGGGPLTTLVLSGSTLWGRLWPNVETQEQIAERAAGSYSEALKEIYPWLKLWSDSDVTPSGANPLLVYWAMPRRIQLVFSPGNGDACSVTGERSDMLVRECRIGAGIKYRGWQHPFTPYRKDGEDWRPIRGHHERIGYRDWLGLVQSTSDESRRPARVVAHARSQRWQIREARLLAYGYASKTALVNAWSEGEMPLLQMDPEIREDMERTAQSLVEAANLAQNALWKAIRAAGYPVDTTSFWEATEPHFWHALEESRRLLETSDEEDPVASVRHGWIVVLRKAAYEAFDRVCPLDLDHGLGMGRVVRARHGLAQTLKGKGSSGKKLLDSLAIAPPSAAA